MITRTTENKKTKKGCLLVLIAIVSLSLFELCFADNAGKHSVNKRDRLAEKTIRKNMNEIFVKKIVLSGDTILAEKVMMEPFEAGVYSFSELHRIAQTLTQNLIRQGYVNSGVIIPDQQLKDNVVVFKLVGGRVKDVEISGLKRLNKRYIMQYFPGLTREIFNINWFQEKLKKLLLNRRIDRVKVDVQATTRRGMAIVKLHIIEKPAQSFDVSLSNHISPNVGEVLAQFNYGNNNLFKQLDTLNLNFRVAEGLEGVNGSYDFPLFENKGHLISEFAYYRSRIVTEPFKRAEIENESNRITLGYKHYFKQDANHTLSLSAKYTNQVSTLYILGSPFSFDDQKDTASNTINKASFLQNYTYRNADNILFLNSQLDLGRVKEDDEDMLRWFSQLQWKRRTAFWDSIFSAKGVLQLSDKTLPASQQFAIGGASSVRGYRENLYTRDNGFLGSLEWKVPLKLNYKLLPQDFTIFYDAGWGWDFDSSVENIDISSVGLGLHWQYSESFGMEFEYASGIQKIIIPATEESVQDKGVHFRIHFSY